MRTLQTDTIHPPFAAYSHGVEIPAGARIVFVSGQLGVARDGTIPEECEEQAALCFGNVAAILGAAGMGLGNVVRINAYVTDRQYLESYMAVRDRWFPAPYPASTLIIVAGFARPEFKLEVEVVAAATEPTS